MHEFVQFFNIGRQHIADVRSIDHILLITALCIRYLFTDWKKVVILITAFSIGNVVAMLLSTFNIVHLSNRWIEFLIPLSIILTAVTNVFVRKFVYKHSYPPIYFLALIFGLIHGLGLFRHYTLLQQLAFNVGIEVGQLFIVLCILLLTFICVNVFKVNRREYILFLSGGVLAVAVQLALQRIPF